MLARIVSGVVGLGGAGPWYFSRGFVLMLIVSLIFAVVEDLTLLLILHVGLKPMITQDAIDYVKGIPRSERQKAIYTIEGDNQLKLDISRADASFIAQFAFSFYCNGGVCCAALLSLGPLLSVEFLVGASDVPMANPFDGALLWTKPF